MLGKCSDLHWYDAAVQILKTSWFSIKYHTDSTVFAGLEPIVNYINSSYKGMH